MRRSHGTAAHSAALAGRSARGYSAVGGTREYSTRQAPPAAHSAALANRSARSVRGPRRAACRRTATSHVVVARNTRQCAASCGGVRCRRRRRLCASWHGADLADRDVDRHAGARVVPVVDVEAQHAQPSAAPLSDATRECGAAACSRHGRQSASGRQRRRTRARGSAAARRRASAT